MIPNTGSQPSKSFYPTRKRDYFLYALSALLLLGGVYFMSFHGGFESEDGVSNILLGVVVASSGYIMSWFISKHYFWLTLVLAFGARLMLLPMESGTEFERMTMESALLAEGVNPFVEVIAFNSGEESDEYGTRDFSSLGSKGTPLSLWMLEWLGFANDSIGWSKMALIALDLSFCLLLGFRFGPLAMIYYAWNPLAIFNVGGLANLDIFFLLPLAVGYLIWENWIGRRGGASLINASGGIQGGLGRLACLSIFLIGVSVSVNLLLLPLLLWFAVVVLHRAGVKAGVVVVGVGLAPVLLPYFWVSFSLRESVWEFLPLSFATEAEALGFFPWIIEMLTSGWLDGNAVGYAMIGAVALYLVFTCDSLERFCMVYIMFLILLMPFVQPWHFLWIAPFAVGIGHLGFRFASVAAFACYWPMRVEIAELPVVSMWPLLWVIFWLPFVIGAAWYIVKFPARSKGLYIKGH